MSDAIPPPPPEPPPTKTPTWKRWWFWAAGVAVILMAISVARPDTPRQIRAEHFPPSSTMTGIVDVEGRDVVTATSVLEAQGFDVRVKAVFTNTAAEETVLHQFPAAGSTLRIGRPVLLLVAKPLPVVPNVIGDNVMKARSALTHAGVLGPISVKQQESSKPTGTIIAQSPKGGTSTKPRHGIKLVVAKAAP